MICKSSRDLTAGLPYPPHLMPASCLYPTPMDQSIQGPGKQRQELALSGTWRFPVSRRTHVHRFLNVLL